MCSQWLQSLQNHSLLSRRNTRRFHPCGIPRTVCRLAYLRSQTHPGRWKQPSCHSDTLRSPSRHTVRPHRQDPPHLEHRSRQRGHPTRRAVGSGALSALRRQANAADLVAAWAHTVSRTVDHPRKAAQGVLSHLPSLDDPRQLAAAPEEPFPSQARSAASTAPPWGLEKGHLFSDHHETCHHLAHSCLGHGRDRCGCRFACS